LRPGTSWTPQKAVPPQQMALLRSKTRYSINFTCSCEPSYWKEILFLISLMDWDHSAVTQDFHFLETVVSVLGRLHVFPFFVWCNRCMSDWITFNL
jgi:hypothetical protein